MRAEAGARPVDGLFASWYGVRGRVGVEARVGVGHLLVAQEDGGLHLPLYLPYISRYLPYISRVSRTFS